MQSNKFRTVLRVIPAILLVQYASSYGKYGTTILGSLVTRESKAVYAAL
jgi:hypothetical protein